MSAELELIARLKNEAKAGLTDLKGGLKDMGVSAEKSSLQLAAVKQQSQLVDAKMNELARSVAKGEKSFDDAERELKQYKSGLVDVGQASDKLDGKTKGLSNTMKAALAAGAVIAGAAIRKMAQEMSKAIDLASIQQDAETQLAQTIESTGMAAGFTADELKGMASGLQDVTTFGDETIIRGQSLLLTFTSIGKEVFPLATEAALDMAQVFGSVDAAAIQLGKALNDPIVGVTALQRVGVSFTESQKDQIRVLQESGDLMGAQTIILDELARQFGGQARAAAETFTGRMQQMNNALGDAYEMVGFALMPAMQTLAEETLPALTQAINDTAPAIESMGTGFANQITLMASTASHDDLRKQLIATGVKFTELNEIVGDGRAGFDLWRTAADMEDDLEKNRAGIRRMQFALEALNLGLKSGSDEFYDYIQAQEDSEKVSRRNEEIAIAMTEAYRDLFPTIEETAEAQRTYTETTEETIAAAIAAEGAFLELDYGAVTLAGHMIDLQISTADATGAFVGSVGPIGEYYTEMDKARGITKDARDEIDQIKADMLGIAGPAQSGASAFGRAAYEIYQDAQEAAKEVADLNDELDDLNGFYKAEIATPGAQEAIDIIAILKGKADETAGTYEIVYNVTVTGDDPPPTGGGATGGGTGNLPAPDEPAFQHGGYTGPGFGIAGVVHRNEFVFSPPAVQALGVDTLNAIHEQARGGGAVSPLGGGGDTFYFSPTVIVQGAHAGTNVHEIKKVVHDELSQLGREAEARYKVRR